MSRITCNPEDLQCLFLFAMICDGCHDNENKQEFQLSIPNDNTVIWEASCGADHSTLNESEPVATAFTFEGVGGST